MRSPLGLVALLLALGCGGDPATELIRIHLSSTQTLDPSQVARVEIVVVHAFDGRCVVQTGSNICQDLQSAAMAEQNDGYVTKATITSADGSSAMIDNLPRGHACFVAEALSQTGQQLALGCVEVELSLERHLIEIELSAL
jgi:hypothetical protein